MKLLIVLVVALTIIASAVGITMNRCSLARRMDAMGVPRSELARWACIAERESSYRTHVVGPANTDDSNDYGIFQINDRYWCQPSNGKYSRNGCGIDCDELLSDDISTSVRCARHILAKTGWSSWTTWKYCNGYLPSIDDCFNSFGGHMVGWGKSEF